MADFYGKIGLLTPTVSIVPKDTGPAHPTLDITMLGGQQLTVPAFQVPSQNPYKISNVWRYPFSGQYSNILLTGGQAQCPIIRGSGSGHVQRAWLRIQVQNQGTSNVEMQPVPLWIQNTSWQTPAGGTIQNPLGSHLWFNIVSTTPMEEWWELSKALAADLDYETGDPIAPNQTITYYVPLTGSFLSAGGFFIPAVSGDIQMYFTFWPDGNIRSTGTGSQALTVLNMSIDVQMEQMAPPLLQRTIELFRRQRMDYIIPFYKNQPFNQALTAGNLTTLNLSNISGDVIYSDLVVRSSYVQDDLSHYQPIASFQYQNQEGVGISGQQFIDDQFSRHIMYPKQNKGTFTRNRRFYRHVFADSPEATRAILERGLKLGAYPFDSHCNLLFNNAAAGSNETWSISQSSTTAPTAGNIVWGWVTPDDSLQLSTPVPFSDLNTAGLPLSTAAIQNILNFSGKVTITGTYAAGNLVITFSGNYGNTALASKGYGLIAFSNLNGGAQILPIPNTAGVDGITSGNTYFIDVYVTTSGVVSILEDGTVKQYNS